MCVSLREPERVSDGLVIIRRAPTLPVLFSCFSISSPLPLPSNPLFPRSCAHRPKGLVLSRPSAFPRLKISGGDTLPRKEEGACVDIFAEGAVGAAKARGGGRSVWDCTGRGFVIGAPRLWFGERRGADWGSRF